MFDAGAADVLSRAPERDLAAAVFTGLERASGAWLYAVGGCWGAADLWLGVLDFILDRPADAEARMRAALQLNHQAGAVALEARAAIELARVVKEKGRETEAAGLVSRGRELAARFGMPFVDRRIEQLGLQVIS
jgi:hypothetical protein